MKRKRTIQVTITIPKMLRRKMLNYQNEHHVNWSKIASQAFREHIRRTHEQANEVEEEASEVDTF